MLPPTIAPVQVVIVPIWKGDDGRAEALAYADKVADLLRGLRVQVDRRDDMKPGAKYFHWERKGVPLRLEIGPRDMAAEQVFAASRTGGPKVAMPLAGLGDTVRQKLDAIQAELHARAAQRLAERTYEVATYDEFKARVDAGGFFQVAWHDDPIAEATIKEETKATIRCYPLGLSPGQRPCFYSGKPATHVAIFARAY